MLGAHKHLQYTTGLQENELPAPEKGTFLLYYSCFNFMLLVHTGHYNFDFN